MQLQVTLVEDDLRDAQRAVAGAKPRGQRTEWRSFVDTRAARRREIMVGSILFPALFVLLVVLSKDHVLHYFRDNPHAVPMVGAFAIAGVASLIFFLVKAPAIRRAAAARNPLLQGPMAVKLSDDGVVVETGDGMSDFRRRAFTRLIESPSLFVLHLRNEQYVLIPKRALPDEGSAEHVRQWFQSDSAGSVAGEVRLSV